jgi:hypothetical protein
MASHACDSPIPFCWTTLFQQVASHDHFQGETFRLIRVTCSTFLKIMDDISFIVSNLAFNCVDADDFSFKEMDILVL